MIKVHRKTTEKIRSALALDPMDALWFGSGMDGRGWYLRRFGASERYLGESYEALRPWLEELEERRAEFERNKREAE